MSEQSVSEAAAKIVRDEARKLASKILKDKWGGRYGFKRDVVVATMLLRLAKRIERECN